MRKIISTMLILLILILSNNVYAKDFSSLLTFNSKDEILNKFSKYNIEGIEVNKNKDEDKIIELSHKTTYLLLGDFNTDKESSKTYYKRHKDYLDLMYYKKIPEDHTKASGLDENSEEYKDYLVAKTSLPTVFLQLNNVDIIYNSYGNVTVDFYNDIAISKVVIKDVKIKKENEKNPMKYEYIKTNLIIYYYFKKLDNDYKLYYLFANTDDDISKYTKTVENNELENKNMITGYNTNLSTMYDYSKLNNVSNETFTNIYNQNINNLVVLKTFYNNDVVGSANGFFITNDLVVTTWSFLDEALSKGQYVTINNLIDKRYNLDGVVLIDVDTDMVVLKVNTPNNSFINIGDKELNINDPVATIGSKTGIKYSLQKGIVVNNGKYIKASVPLTRTDRGSILVDMEGKVVGFNTSRESNSNTSVFIKKDVLKEIKDKLNNGYDVITFEELKKNYYVKYDNENKVNNIPNKVWREFSKQGNIEKNINFELIKANYKDGIISLRYKNNISNYVSSIQLASKFTDQLISDGYKKTLNNTNKNIYENDKYKVIIMDEFNYLIIVMVKK